MRSETVCLWKFLRLRLFLVIVCKACLWKFSRLLLFLVVVLCTRLPLPLPRRTALLPAGRPLAEPWRMLSEGRAWPEQEAPSHADPVFALLSAPLQGGPTGEVICLKM